MTHKNLGLVEEERKPKPKLEPLAKACEEYKEAKMEAQVAKRQLWEEAQKNGESAEEVQRRQQGAFMREMRVRHTEKQAKAAVQTQQPVPKKKKTQWTKTRRSPKLVKKKWAPETLRLRWWLRWWHHGRCLSRWR